MTDKEKKIEEMAREMSKELCCYYDKQKRKCSNCFGMKEDCDLHCNFGRTLERLSKAGYRKIDKDSIVLSKEEKQEFDVLVKLLTYDKPVKSRVFDVVKGIKNQASKETAEKIYQQLQEHGTTYVKKWIAKQFGVEIKEE